jgi:hypothetical protein
MKEKELAIEGSYLYREADLRAHEILASRQAVFKKIARQARAAGTYHESSCMACNLAATNIESGCLKHGVISVRTA